MSLKIIKLRKSHERFRSNREWLNSMHSFSFAEHKDPKWDNFGKIRVINEDIISPNAGFNKHSHANMEIITVVTKGAITHRDSLNNLGKIYKDEVQVMSAVLESRIARRMKKMRPVSCSRFGYILKKKISNLDMIKFH